jgi:hypothetical protein
MYRLEASIIGRSSGGSALAAAAYRSAERLTDQTYNGLAAAAYISGEALQYNGVTHDYSRKGGVVHREIALPEGAPAFMEKREELWASVEAAEQRRDAQLAREFTATLPRGLSRDDRLDLVRNFVAAEITGKGLVADFAIHEVRARDGGLNVHVHILTSLRRVDASRPTGWERTKARDLNGKAQLAAWREAWAEQVNYKLAERQIAERVDHRSLKAQLADALERSDFEAAAKLDRKPEPKLGKAVTAMERKGVRTERGDKLREVQAYNAEVQAAWQSIGKFGPAAQRCFMALRLKLGDALKALEAWREHLTEWAREVRGFVASAFAAEDAERDRAKRDAARDAELKPYQDQQPAKVFLSPAEKFEREVDRSVAALERVAREGRSERRLQQEAERKMQKEGAVKGSEFAAVRNQLAGIGNHIGSMTDGELRRERESLQTALEGLSADSPAANGLTAKQQEELKMAAQEMAARFDREISSREATAGKAASSMSREERERGAAMDGNAQKQDWRAEFKAERKAEQKQRADEKARDREKFGDDWRAAAKARRERERERGRDGGMSL